MGWGGVRMGWVACLCVLEEREHLRDSIRNLRLRILQSRAESRERVMCGRVPSNAHPTPIPRPSDAHPTPIRRPSHAHPTPIRRPSHAHPTPIPRSSHAHPTPIPLHGRCQRQTVRAGNPDPAGGSDPNGRCRSQRFASRFTSSSLLNPGSKALPERACSSESLILICSEDAAIAACSSKRVAWHGMAWHGMV